MYQLSELPTPVIRFSNGIWRRRWLVIAAAWIAAIVGWLAVWLLPNQFESRAQVFVQTESILQPVLNGFTARPDYTRRVEVMRLQLLTRPNVEEIILRSGLDSTIQASSAIERRARMEGLVNSVSGSISILSPRDMYFIISYRDQDPELARSVVDAVLNLLIEQDLGASLSENEAARRTLNLQVEEYEEKLFASEQRVAEFRRKNATELAASQGTVRQREQKEAELLRLGDEIERTRGRVISLQNLMSATARTSSGDELDKLKVELANLRSRYEESHPDIRGVLARIEQLENAGGGLSSNTEYVRLSSELRVARDSITSLEARKRRVEDDLTALDRAVGLSPAVVAAVQQLERRHETLSKTYDELLERRDRLNLTENLGPAGRGVEYQVFERPERAIAPVAPPRLLFSLAIFVLAPLAGIASAVALTLIDRGFSQTEELRKAFGLPVLGAVTIAPSGPVIARRKTDLMRMVIACAALFVIGVVFTYLSVFRLPTNVAGLEKSTQLMQNSPEAF